MDLPTDSRALAALYRISALAGRRHEPRMVLRSILQTIIEAIGGVSGDVSLVNPDSGELEIEISSNPDGLDEEDMSMRLGQGITGWVAFHGRPQLVPDVARDSRYVRIRDHVRSEMVAPMISENGQVLGVINVDGDRVEAFSSADLDLLMLLTDEATIVISRHWQLHNLTDKARQLESLITIGQALVAKLEPQDLFNSITRDARQITALRACALYLHEIEAGTARLVSYDGPKPDHLPTDALPLTSCLVGSTIHTRKPVEFVDLQSPELGEVIDLPREASLRSLLATPLLIEDDVIGVLVVFTGAPHRFNNDEKRLLGALASLGAVALQNSRLYTRVFHSEATLRRNEQLTTLGLLAAEIAHEIRNPLTVLQLLFGTLKLDFPAEDPRRTDARVITEKLAQLEAIVSRVLNFAQAPSNLHSRWKVTDIIADTLVLIRLKLTQGKIQLHFATPAESWMIEGHKGQLQQALLNVLLNATQAMPDGGAIAIELTTEPRPEGGRNLVIDVTDSGQGIDREMSERIFDSFLSGRPDGTGLGLSIAKRILVSHHGDIVLRSTGPTGTTMRIILPLDESS